MGEFLSEITFSEFKKLRPEQLKELKSCEVTFNTQYLFTFINGNLELSGFLRRNCQFKGAAANAVSGKSLEDILNSECVPV